MLGNNDRTIFKGFIDGQNDKDLDNDGFPDNAELWINMIHYVLLVDPASTHISFDVDVTAAPCKTALLKWSSGPVADKWEQVGGAFFRSIKRRE